MSFHRQMRACKVDSHLLGILRVFLLWCGYFDFGAAVHGAMMAGMMTYLLPDSHFCDRMSDNGNLKKERLALALRLRVLPIMAEKEGSKRGSGWGSKDGRHMSSHMSPVRKQGEMNADAHQVCLFPFPSLI